MIKAILFDFWGTLVENGVKSPIKQVKSILNIRSPFSEYVIRMERAMMTKTFPSLKEAFQSICDEFNVPCSEQKMEELIGMWNKAWMLAEPYDEVDEVLKELRKKYKIILVSNTDCFSINNVLEKFALRRYFDGIVLSYEVGMIKTDKNFLKVVLNDFGLMADECLMIGDSVQSDVAAALRLGMKAVLIDRNDSREFNPKIKNLKELNTLFRLFETDE